MKKHKFLILLIIASSLFRLDPAAVSASSSGFVNILFTEPDVTATCKITVEQELRTLFDTDEPDYDDPPTASDCTMYYKFEFDPPLSGNDGMTLLYCCALHMLMSVQIINNVYDWYIHEYVFTWQKTAKKGDAEISFEFNDLVEYTDEHRCGGTAVEYSIWFVEPDGDYVIFEYTSNGGGIITAGFVNQHKD